MVRALSRKPFNDAVDPVWIVATDNGASLRVKEPFVNDLNAMLEPHVIQALFALWVSTHKA